jgi:DME family drug/metabolite transporter
LTPGADTPRQRLLGYAEAVGAACLWGSSGIFAVNLFRLGVPPESLALLRPLLGSALLLAIVTARNPSALVVDRKGLLILLGGGGITVGFFQIAYQFSTDAVGVPSTVAMLYIAPAIVAVASGPLLGEWPDRTRIALLVVTLSGVWLSVLGADEVVATFGSSGVVWGVLAGASYGAYILLGRFAAPRYGSIRTVVYSSVGSCLFLAVAVPATTGAIVLPGSGRAWVLLVVFSVLTITVAHTMFFDALKRIDASRVSIASAVEPVVAGILATLLLAQGLSPIGWAGIGLVAIGVVGVGLTTRNEEGGTPDPHAE